MTVDDDTTENEQVESPTQIFVPAVLGHALAWGAPLSIVDECDTGEPRHGRRDSLLARIRSRLIRR